MPDHVTLSLQELKAEFAKETIGPLIFRCVRQLVEVTIKKYDYSAPAYAGTPSWSEGIDDLVQEFVVDTLLEGGQLEYALIRAADFEHFFRILSRQLRHLLARRRRRTIIDNLLDRSKKIASEPPFQLLNTGTKWSYSLAGKPLTGTPPLEECMEELRIRILALPTVRSAANERSPVVFGNSSLVAALVAAAEIFPCAVEVRHLDDAFRYVLTPWVPSFLILSSEVSEDRPTSMNAEDAAMAKDLAQVILRTLSDVQKVVLRLKLGGMSDGDIANRLELSRPTVSKRKQEVTEVFEEQLADLSPDVQEAVIDGVTTMLVASGVQASG